VVLGWQASVRLPLSLSLVLSAPTTETLASPARCAWEVASFLLLLLLLLALVPAPHAFPTQPQAR